jgi:hypothetical protein
MRNKSMNDNDPTVDKRDNANAAKNHRSNVIDSLKSKLKNKGDNINSRSNTVQDKIDIIKLKYMQSGLNPAFELSKKLFNTDVYKIAKELGVTGKGQVTKQLIKENKESALNIINNAIANQSNHVLNTVSETENDTSFNTKNKRRTKQKDPATKPVDSLIPPIPKAKNIKQLEAQIAMLGRQIAKISKKKDKTEKDIQFIKEGQKALVTLDGQRAALKPKTKETKPSVKKKVKKKPTKPREKTRVEVIQDKLDKNPKYKKVIAKEKKAREKVAKVKKENIEQTRTEGFIPTKADEKNLKKLQRAQKELSAIRVERQKLEDQARLDTPVLEDKSLEALESGEQVEGDPVQREADMEEYEDFLNNKTTKELEETEEDLSDWGKPSKKGDLSQEEAEELGEMFTGEGSIKGARLKTSKKSKGKTSSKKIEDGIDDAFTGC